MKISQTNNLKNTDVLIPVFNGYDPQKLSSILSELGIGDTSSITGDFRGETGDTRLFYNRGFKIFLLGFGKKDDFGSVYKTSRQFSCKQKKQLGHKLTVCVNHLTENTATITEALLNGIITGSYHIGVWKSGEQDVHSLADEKAEIRVYTDTQGIAGFDVLSRRALVVSGTQIRMLDLVNTPSNVKTPSYISDWAVDSASAYEYELTILSDEAIWDNNLLALAAVNRGSEESARFIIMDYKPKGKGTFPKAGLVGKGVTYDTGGLSIKPSASMSYMKSDMAGAAAVMGAFEAAVRLQLPVELTAVIPVTDNLIDSNSFKPGDIINSHSGRTIEVLDTDAEGRLILADGLSWLTSNREVDYLLDLATLTGATVRALGTHAGGLFTNNDELSVMLMDCGQHTGERLWRLPLWDEYGDELKSDVADIKNISRTPTGAAIHAAKFLETFTGNHPAWAHMDIAGVAFGDTEFGKDKGGTAYGIRLLIEFLQRISI